MSFTIICNQCNTKQTLISLINPQNTTHNIIVDISFQDSDSPEYDNILFECQNPKCNNTFEL